MRLQTYPSSLRNKRGTRFIQCAGAFLIAGILSCTLVFPTGALADVRKSDIVIGQTVSARSLALSRCPNIDAEHAIVVGSDGTTYFERDADTRVHIASITKVMTAATAIDSVPLDTTITVSSQAARIGESTAALQEGDTMPLSEALKALLWPSGNDAAWAIAESIGGMMLTSSNKDASDSSACVQAFVDAMNAKSADLGMNDSIWSNPHGLDDGSWSGDFGSTARDISKLIEYAMSKDAIRSITSTDGGTCKVLRNGEQVSFSLDSTDELLGSYEGTIGVKTGFTDSAGECFAGAVETSDITLYSVALDSTSEKKRFTDTRTLWDWVFNHRINYSLAHTENTTVDASGTTVPLAASVALGAWTDKTVDATFSDASAEVMVCDLEGNVSQQATWFVPNGAVKAGDIVGRIDYYQHNTLIATENLVATQSVDAPDFFTGIGIWWQRFISGFSGESAVAQSILYNETPKIDDRVLQKAA